MAEKRADVWCTECVDGVAVWLIIYIACFLLVVYSFNDVCELACYPTSYRSKERWMFSQWRLFVWLFVGGFVCQHDNF